jgi:hypothetical protein
VTGDAMPGVADCRLAAVVPSSSPQSWPSHSASYYTLSATDKHTPFVDALVSSPATYQVVAGMTSPKIVCARVYVPKNTAEPSHKHVHCLPITVRP